MINCQDVLGYQVVNCALDTCADSILRELSVSSAKQWLACINPHSYVTALNENEFNEALHAANWIIPDGQGIVLASKILGGSIQERLTGSDIFYALNSRLNKSGGFSVFFLGSTQECLDDIRIKMTRDYPNIRFAGTYSPPFKNAYSEDELEEMVAVINKSRADVLWVGMTAPKQEKWIYNNLYRVDIKFAAAVGAVFDFYTGKVVRSHPFFQKCGLEWLPRLIQQPMRLWRRMFVSAPIFLWHVIRKKIGTAADDSKKKRYSV